MRSMRPYSFEASQHFDTQVDRLSHMSNEVTPQILDIPPTLQEYVMAQIGYDLCAEALVVCTNCAGIDPKVLIPNIDAS